MVNFRVFGPFLAKIFIKEEHYTVRSEPGGKYLWHFVPEEATKERKHAEVIADHLVNWLKERGVEESLQARGDEIITESRSGLGQS